MRYREFMSEDDKRARLLLKIRDVGTRNTLALVRTLDAKMARLFPAGSGITARPRAMPTPVPPRLPTR